jgi:MFS family permease
MSSVPNPNSKAAAPTPTYPAPRRWFNRTIVGAGITSAFGDFAYETTNVILPGFLAVLGVPAAVLGIIEGVADAVMSFTKLAAGHIANRLGKRKSLVVIGYALTPVGQAMIAVAAGWPLILLGRCISWFGKGLRGPLRDTIIAESITPQTRGRAFGFHRAMDTVGAVLGPLLGVGLLALAQRWHLSNASSAFRLVFWMTLIPGVLSFLSFAILVKDDRSLPNKAVRFWSSIRDLPPKFKRFLLAVGIFGIGDFSHSLLILAATQLLTPDFGIVHAAQIAGLLYVARNIFQTLSSYPIGALADRIGHQKVLLIGYVLGAMTAGTTVAAFLIPLATFPLLAVVFTFAAFYVAIQDALEPSLAAQFVPAEARNIGFSALGAVNGFGKLVSSISVGFIWTLLSPALAFALAAILMTIGAIALSRSDNTVGPNRAIPRPQALH